jgi:L-alanine-DL-glutamate epimerase-like enolase superfamily enzyme
MPRPLRIRRVAVHRFGYQVPDLGVDYNGFNHVYQAGSCLNQSGYVLEIGTDMGITGEYVGGTAASYAEVGMVAEYLLGKNPLEREKIYNDLKRALRKHDRMGIGPIDVALWDVAGKLYDAPVSELLGGFRRTLPAYASTYYYSVRALREAGGVKPAASRTVEGAWRF